MSGRRFSKDDRPYATPRSFQLEEIPQVESAKLETIERAAIERAVSEREAIIQTLQADVLEIRGERNALESRLSRLESERDELRDRIQQLEVERPNLEPKTVFSNLGSAVGDVRTELDTANYTIDDVAFSLKANVVQDDGGIRLHLPSLDERFASENLSEISFRVRAGDAETERPESEYSEVPDLVGTDLETAERRLNRAGLTVGAVTTVEDATSAPNTVVDQFPEPYALAPPEAPVDLTVTEERHIEEADTEPTEQAGEQPSKKLEAIDGIGPTYAQRLREAGVTGVAALAEMDPEAVAEIATTSASRAASWVEQARSMSA
jgi:predicted flap endonuclease-1-like 5' DNA nuclease/FtsZ-binding cell division protein ZapB